jgi:hypothetical protein
VNHAVSEDAETEEEKGSEEVSIARVEKDEWTPQLRKMMRGLAPAARKARLARTGYKVVALLKVKMDQQVGFADGTPYKKLKIKFRYHGTKTVRATKKNIARRARGAQVRMGTFTRAGGQTLLDSRSGKVITVTDKTPVTASTKALIDLGDLKKSWDVLLATGQYVDIGNLTPLEKLKAYYNDDRGAFGWGRISSDEAIGFYMQDFDKAMGFA